MSDIMITFEDIKARIWDDVPKPKSLPSGWWRLRVRSAKLNPPKEEGKKTQAIFLYEPQEPLENVSPEELDALGDNYSVRDNQIWHRVFIADNRELNQLRDHLDKHDVDLTGQTIPDSIKLVIGRDIEAFVRSVTRKDAVRGMVTDDEIVAVRAVKVA